MSKANKKQKKNDASNDASKDQRIAVYGGSFDPLTLGHLDIIERAAQNFDLLIVGVGETVAKKPLFSTAQRLKQIEKATKHLPNVEVRGFSGLIVRFAKKCGAAVLVRGIRSGTDYAYEAQMAQMNLVLEPTLDTVFLPTKPQFAHISSSLTKEVAFHGGDVSLLVPPSVSVELTEKMKS
jgi:pantetheine-phosphate adenylyltransferase